jgi:para-nitrobenzyl esterase
MASPMARGLFQKAIGESGAAFGSVMPIESLAVREKTDGEWLDSAFGVKSLKELRAMPAGKLIDAVKPRGLNGFWPVIDGRFLTEPVADTYAAGKQAKVPLLAGWNRDEASFFASRGMTVKEFENMANDMFKERAAEFLKFYPAGNNEEALRSYIDYFSDSFMGLSTWKWLEAQRSTGDSPVYRYHFELAALPSRFHPGNFAFHSDEIEYVFGTLSVRPGETVRTEDRKLSDQMMSYWTNFARTGDPNGPSLSTWPKYDKEEPLIHLDSVISSGPDALRPRYEFLLKGIPPFHF